MELSLGVAISGCVDEAVSLSTHSTTLQQYMYTATPISPLIGYGGMPNHNVRCLYREAVNP